MESSMQIRWSKLKTPLVIHLHRGRFLIAFVLVAALLIAAHVLFTFRPDSISVAGLLFLPLMLFAALSVGREFLTPSLKELAFYSFAIIAAGLIWPAAHLAVSAYEASGFMTLVIFMAFVFALAVALGVLSMNLLASENDEN